MPTRAHSIGQRIRLVFQGGLPAFGVLIVVTLVAAIAYYVHEANRNGALSLSNDLVTAIETRVSTEMYSYLEPSQRLVELIDAVVDGRPVMEGKGDVEALARHALSTIQSATGVSYAGTRGNFLYVLRNDDGTISIKLIDQENGRRRVTWTRRSPEGAVISVEEDPTDTFDPRERPWYLAAASARKPIWTGTYQNLTLRRPAISHIIPRFGPDGGLRTVIGIDIELDDLCTFLSKLAIGVRGKAYIIDRSGRIIAFPSEHWTPANDESVPAPRLDEMGDPVLTRAYDRLRVEGFGRKVLTIGNRRVIVSAEPVKMLAGHDWLVLIVVPEADFVGFVSDSSLVASVMSFVVVTIMVGLAGLLGWRNVLAGRRVAMATLRQQTLEARSRAIVEVGREMAGREASGRDLETATETAAEAGAARRAAVWRLSEDGRTLSCEDYYDREAKDHAAGLTIHRDEVPVLFAALDEGAVIDSIGARGDKRVTLLADTYLRPLGIENIYISPIMLGDRPIGMLSVEDAEGGDRAAGLAAFCDALALLLALKFGGEASVPEAQAGNTADDSAPRAQEANDSPDPDALALRQTRLEQSLIHRGSSLDALSRGAMTGAAIGIVKLPEWSTVTRSVPDGSAQIEMEAIVEEIRSITEGSDLSYATRLDDQIVVAACSPRGVATGRDALSVATALLDMRDRLVQLEEHWVTSLDFRFGIDVGSVMNSAANGSPANRSLWGGAIGVARIMAETTTRHTIATSETAYQLLSRQFQFRPRGRYYLPETGGSMRTFILVGRL